MFCLLLLIFDSFELIYQLCLQVLHEFHKAGGLVRRDDDVPAGKLLFQLALQDGGLAGDDEIAAEAMGISLFKHKMLSFVISSFFAGVGGALFAMYVANAQAKAFTSVMTYEILLIVVIGGIGSVSGSVLATFLYVACSEWWLRFLDSEQYIGSFKVPLLRNGFRMVVFSIVIMVIVLFFSQGIMGNHEINLGALIRKISVKSERKQ